MQGGDLDRHACASICGLHDSTVFALLSYVGKVHSHDPHFHLVAQPLPQFAPRHRPCLLEIVKDSGAPQWTTQRVQGIGDCPQLIPRTE